MRAAKLPPESSSDSDDLKSLRINVACAHPDSMRAAVSDSYAALVEQLSGNKLSDEPKPKK